jgi:hypothetical protein
MADAIVIAASFETVRGFCMAGSTPIRASWKARPALASA